MRHTREAHSGPVLSVATQAKKHEGLERLEQSHYTEKKPEIRNPTKGGASVLPLHQILQQIGSMKLNK